MKKKLEKSIWEKISEVIDPELYISIIDLGLVYSIDMEKGKVHITMTLTSLGCPLFATIEKDIKEKLAEIKEVKDVYIELVFDPPWSMEKMSERGKAMMGI